MTCDELNSLESLINRAIKIDNRLSYQSEGQRECRAARSPPRHPAPSQPATCSTATPCDASEAPLEEPMQLGRTGLSPEEHSKRVSLVVVALLTSMPWLIQGQMMFPDQLVLSMEAYLRLLPILSFTLSSFRHPCVTSFLWVGCSIRIGPSHFPITNLMTMRLT